MKPIKLVALLVALMVSAQAYAVRSVLWDRTAIRINLVVGVEQMIHFPADGDVGLPPTLANADVFRTLYTGKTAYWTALQPFASERIKVRLAGGDYVLFDVTAVNEPAPPASVEALNVVLEMDDASEGDSEEEPLAEEPITVFELIRYAAQMTYSPTRLVGSLPNVRQAPLAKAGNLNRLYNHQNHHGLIFSADKSWTAGGLFVTSIRVKNGHSHAVALDNRRVQHTLNASINGVDRHFIASAFYRQNLYPAGQPGDKTTLFVVTDQPFNTAIRLGGAL